MTGAQWLLPRLAEGTFEVRMTVPACFAACARVFYPFARPNVISPALTRWAVVARRNGRMPHAETERKTITRSVPGLPGEPQGFTPGDVLPSLPSEQFGALAAILARHTATADRTWFCIWEGYGNLGLSSAAGRTLARLHRPMRDYVVFTGPVDAWRALADGGHSSHPEYWWPDDRAWCFATDTDFHWTYIRCREPRLH